MAMCESSSDTMAEWLRRGTANPLGSARASSNLVSIVFLPFSARFHVIYPRQELSRQPSSIGLCVIVNALEITWSVNELKQCGGSYSGKCTILRTIELIRLSSKDQLAKFLPVLRNEHQRKWKKV